jgi:hypothetical protein
MYAYTQSTTLMLFFPLTSVLAKDREERCGWTKAVKYPIPYGSRLKYNYMVLYLSGYRGFTSPYPVVNVTFNFKRADGSALSYVHSMTNYRSCAYSWKCFQATQRYPLGYRNPWNPAQFVYLSDQGFFHPAALRILSFRTQQLHSCIQKPTVTLDSNFAFQKSI